jgi:hypothetical protein
LPRALRPCPVGHVMSLLWYATFSWLGEKPSFASFPPRIGKKAMPGARQHLAEGKACRWFYHRHPSWSHSRKCLRVKGCRHGRASEDADRGTLKTSLRSSVTGATLAITMPLASPALRGLPLALSHLLRERSATAWAICSPDSGCLRLLPASGLMDGFLPLGSGGRPAISALVWPLLNESLSFLLVKRAERQVLGPPLPEHRH